MHEPPCDPLKKCRAETSDRLTILEEKVCIIEQTSQEALDILKTWNEGKTVIKWLRVASKIVIWVAATWAAIVAVGKYLKDYL